MRGRHSEAGKEELGPYIRGKDESCSIKGHTSALNSPPDLKNQVEWVSSGYSGSTYSHLSEAGSWEVE